MMVKDKTRDIAVLRTLGAGQGVGDAHLPALRRHPSAWPARWPARCIGIVFCLNIETIRQWLQGLTGTNLFNPEVYFLSRLPAVVQWHEVAQVVGMALVLSLLATLYPSWRAARTDPVEALRNE